MENKRLKKIIRKKGLERWLKPVTNDNDPVDFILLEYPKCLTFSIIVKPKEYKEAVERGENIPKELTHYLTIHNKKDRKTIETKFINTCDSVVVKKIYHDNLKNIL